MRLINTRLLHTTECELPQTEIYNVKRTVTGHVLLVFRLTIAEPIEGIIHTIDALVVEILPTRILQCPDGMQG